MFTTRLIKSPNQTDCLILLKRDFKKSQTITLEQRMQITKCEYKVFAKLTLWLCHCYKNLTIESTNRKPIFVLFVKMSLKTRNATKMLHIVNI